MEGLQCIENDKKLLEKKFEMLRMAKSLQKTSVIPNSCFFGLLSILFKIERTTFLKDQNASLDQQQDVSLGFLKNK